MFRLIGREIFRVILCAIITWLLVKYLPFDTWLDEKWQFLFNNAVTVLGCIIFLLLYCISFIVVLGIYKSVACGVIEENEEYEAKEKELLAKIKDLEQQVESKTKHIIKQNEQIHTLQELIDLKRDQANK